MTPEPDKVGTRLYSGVVRMDTYNTVSYCIILQYPAHQIDYILYHTVPYRTYAHPPVDSPTWWYSIVFLVSHNRQKDRFFSTPGKKKDEIPRRLDGFSSLPSFFFWFFFPFFRLHFWVRLYLPSFSSFFPLFSFPLTITITTVTTTTTTSTITTIITITTTFPPDYVSALYCLSQFSSASPDFCLAVTTFHCARPTCSLSLSN